MKAEAAAALREPRMSRNATRLPIALALLALVFLSPTLATAFPQGAILSSAAERPEATPGLFSTIWDLFSAVWTIGSVLEPNGAGTNTGPGTDPNAAGSRDTGSGLDPNG